MNETIHAHSSSAMVRALAEIAYDAGRIVLKHYTEEIVSRRKEDHSPVTAADEEAEKFILARLAHLAPDLPVIAEEEAAAGRLAKIGHHFFLVDPLDGTKEFISRNGEFTVNIAEVIDGKPVRGVVYAPAIDRLFFGEALSGAFEIQAKPGGAPDFGEASRIAVRRVPADGMTAVASRSHRDSKTDEYLAAYKIKDFISAGSSLKFCLVAAGEADIYPRHGRTMEWDTAAGHAVLAAAGGSVTQLDGKPFLYGKVEESFANPFFVARGAES
jgi:3'(2'), 5'-bisphosphate nucleotidase